MPKNIKCLIGLSIVLLYACQDNPVEEFTSGSQSLFSYNGNNNAGKSLLHQLKNHSSLQEGTRELLNAREELLYDHAVFRSGEVYGLYYLVPVRDKASGVVNKALVYKVDAKADQGKVRLTNTLSEVLVLDEAELSQIPAYRRFLYSYPFKQWEDQGLKVLSSLSACAKRLDGKLVPAETSELPSPVSKILTSWVTVTYELHLNVEIEGGGVVVYGIPSSEVEAILIRNAGVFQVYVDEAIDISVDYETITIRSVGGDIVSHPDLYTAIDNLMWACDADLAAEYPYYNAITWQVTSTSADPPEEDDDDNNNTGGNTGGGSTGGGSSTTPSTDNLSPSGVVNHLFRNSIGDDISLLVGVIDSLMSECAYRAVLNYLLTGNSFEVIYDPNLGDGTLYGGASASATSTKLKFRDSTSIKTKAISEELYHMYQYRYLNINSLVPMRHLVEFEAHLFRDIAAYVKHGGDDVAAEQDDHRWACLNLTSSDDEREEYFAFLDSLTSDGTGYNGTTISEEDFRRWANVFGRISIMYNAVNGGLDYNQAYTMTINNMLYLVNQNCNN